MVSGQTVQCDSWRFELRMQRYELRSQFCLWTQGQLSSPYISVAQVQIIRLREGEKLRRDKALETTRISVFTEL